MKNIDIEQLERKNIYTTPENFFAEMQTAVLEKTVQDNVGIDQNEIKEKGKIIPLKWWYAAAAAVVFLFGAVFFVNSDDAVPEAITAQNTVAPKTEVIMPAETENVSEKTERAAEVVMPILAAAPASDKATSVKKSFEEPEESKKIKTKNKTEQEEIDFLVESIPQQELMAMTSKDQYDIYLDLYY